MPNQQQAPDQSAVQWLDLDDFTPGIYSNSTIAFSEAPNTQPGPFAAPAGSADASETWQCVALPQGGLGPFFGVINTFTLDDLGITDPPVTGYIAGWVLTGVSLDDEIVVCIEYQESGDNNVHIWESTFGAAGANELYTNSFSTPPDGGVGGSPYPFATRVAASDPTTTIGEIVIAIPIADSGDILLYPNPSDPSAIGIYDFMSTLANILFGHQNRICCLEAVTLTWPITATANANTDAINYTDPPNSETFPGTTPSTIFVAEQPYGYGAVGSINAGELFMVKVRGGGVVVQGDINNPTVTALPGVRPTGPIFGHADSNEAGLFYCAQAQGAHLWAGGSVSAKISLQLDDDFFVPSNVVPSRYFNYFCKRFDRFMLFSNNWAYDPQTNSWWRFLNPATASLFGYDVGFDTNQFYGNINQVASDAVTCFYEFDKTVPASSWQWQSLPIRVSENRLVDFREVMVRYSNPYGGDSGDEFTIQVSGIDEAGNVYAADPLTYTGPVDRPQMARFPIGAKSEDITVRIACSNGTPGNPAPVVHGISCGYRTREKAPTT